MRMLFTTSASPLGLAWPPLCDEQVVFGPLHLDLDLGGRVFTRRVPLGDYDLAAQVALLPEDQRPDITACVVDGLTASWPRNLAACSGPRLLLVGDAGWGPDGLTRLLAYARSEPFEQVVLIHGCRHEAAFLDAGFARVSWFPGLLCPVHDAWLPIVRQPERRPRALCAPPDSSRPAVQLACLESLSRAGVLLGCWSDHPDHRLEELGNSLAAVVPSEGGEWAPELFEALAAGAFAVVVGPGVRQGVERLWPEGAPLACVDEAAQLPARLAACMELPASVADARAAAAAWYDRFLGAAPRRAAFEALALAGRPAVAPPAPERAPARPRPAAADDGPEGLAGALAALEEGDDARAAEWARRRLEAQPDDIEGHLISAEVQAAARSAEGFDRHRLAVQRQRPHDPRLLALARRCGLGHTSLAHRRARQGWRLYASGALEEALACVGPVAAKEPGSLSLQVLLAHLFTCAGKHDAAADAWLRAARHHPNEDDLWFNLGLAQWRAGRQAEAGQALRRAADHAPHVAAHRAAFELVRRLEPSLPGPEGPERALVVASSENCQKHGAGVLIKRFFTGHAGTITLRPFTFYEGMEEVGSTHLCVPFQNLSAAETQTRLRRLLLPYAVRHVLCVPFRREECLYALAAQAVTGARLCTYVMDDRNVLIPDNDDELLEELFRRSSLRLAISSELQMAYSIKFNHDFDVMPPIVVNRDARRTNRWTTKLRPANHCALVGNVWTEGQMKQLAGFVARTGLVVDWYGRQASAVFAAPGIRMMGFVPESDLADCLSEYPFVLVPSGMLDGSEDNEWLTRLSLPSRIVFLLQTQTPILVLGSKDTCASRHVAQLGIGRSMAYSHPAPAEVLREFTAPAARARHLKNAERAADGFVMPEAGRWIWDSTDAGRALDAPFHAFMERVPALDVVWPPEAAGRMPFSHVQLEPAGAA